ncbi:MAG: NfeD-like C-terminal, partner-binding [Deltaproteobacteria bacterium]|nr:NfeD-like C-terminal, partner-binding [Deltaproteobacteria bacterium]
MLSQWKQSAIGKRAMIGDSATILKPQDGSAHIRYNDEVRLAKSQEPFVEGQKVIIRDVEGLTAKISLLPLYQWHRRGPS